MRIRIQEVKWMRVRIHSPVYRCPYLNKLINRKLVLWIRIQTGSTQVKIELILNFKKPYFNPWYLWIRQNDMDLTESTLGSATRTRKDTVQWICFIRSEKLFMRLFFTNYVLSWSRIRIQKNGWIRIRKKWMRIHSSAFVPHDFY